jgi:hypothetical protein
MEMSPHVAALRDDLAALGDAGDPTTAEVARRIARALEPAIRLRLLEVLSQAAAELDAQLPGGRVEVRLEGGEPVLVVAGDLEPALGEAPDEGSTARITLRLPEGLKAQAEAAAAPEGMSLNAWLVRAVAAAARRRASGRTLRGFARS